MIPTDLDPAAILEVMHAVLDEDPSDVVTRLVVADLSEDAGGRVAAQGQRWQALYGKWPAPGPPDWRWWDGAFSGMEDPDDLPHGVFAALGAGHREDARIARYYPSRRAAEDDLALALETPAAGEARPAGYDGGPCPRCGGRERVTSGRERACDSCGRGQTE